jgi:hypothetical protein
LGNSNVKIFIHHTANINTARTIYPRDLYVAPDDREGGEGGKGGEREKEVCKIETRVERHQMVMGVQLPSLP